MNTYHFGYSVHYSVAVEADSVEDAKNKIMDPENVRQTFESPVRLIFVDLDTDGGGSPNDD
jgi:hypothetical protein